MAIKPAHLVARLAWFAPALLVFLTFNQAKVAFDLRATWQHGERATAEILEYEYSNRADVVYDYVSLRVPLPTGNTITKEKMSLPHSLLPRLEGEKEVAVRVNPGAAQEVVIEQLMPAHWLIAASQAGMSFLGALLAGTGVFFWNRWQKRQAAEQEEAEASSA